MNWLAGVRHTIGQREAAATVLTRARVTPGEGFGHRRAASEFRLNTMQKQSTPRNMLFEFLCGWVYMACLSSSDAESLKGTSAQFNSLLTSYVHLRNYTMKELQEFTVCIDLNLNNELPGWTAFTYDVSETEGLDFGLAGTNDNLILYHFSSLSSFGRHLPRAEWYSVCSTWNGTEMNVYVNGSSVFTKNFPLNSLKANGSLVLGFIHKNQNHTIVLNKTNNFIGNLYYFQMWNYVKPPAALQDCSEGNIISWKTEFWEFKGPTKNNDTNLRCANELIESTSNPTSMTVPQSTKATLGSKPSSTRKTLPETSSSEPLHTTMNIVETTGLTSLPVLTSTLHASLTTWNVSESTTFKLPLTVHSFTVTMHKPKSTTIILPNDTTEATSQMTPPFSQPTAPEVHFKTTTANSILPTSASKHQETSHLNQVTSMTISAVSTTTPEVTFYVIRMNMTVRSNEGIVADENDTRALTGKLLESIFKETEFKALHFTVTEGKELRKTQFSMTRNLLEEPPSQNSLLRNRERLSAWYGAKAILEAKSSDNQTEITVRIKSLLQNKYHSEGHFELHLETVDVAYIDPETCPRDTTSNEKGTYHWHVTLPMKSASLPCERNHWRRRAHRMCSISLETEKANWKEPELRRCWRFNNNFPDTINGFQNITITSDNAEEAAEHILLLIGNRSRLSKEEVDIIITKTSEIIEKGDIDEIFGNTTLHIISALLEKADHLREFTNRILKMTDQLGDKITLTGQSVNITAASLAVAVTGVDLNLFNGVFFTITSYFEGAAPEVHIHEDPLNIIADYIFLPKSLQNHIYRIISRIQFNFYGTTALFQDNTVSSSTVLNTYVVGAGVTDKKVQNLNDPVVVKLRHIKRNEHNAPVHCVFWDWEMNNNFGGWSTIGCEIQLSESTENYTTCYCTHLTHFGVLMDLSGAAIDAVNERILTIITYIGCGISSIFLGVALVTYIALVQLRKDNPSKILMNLCSALLLLNLMFLLNTWLSSFQSHGLCITTAVLLHYFLLVSFTWMGLEAVHMYFALVKVFNVYIPNYILKFCIVGWGVPAIIVITVVIVNRDFYGTRHESVPELSASSQDSDSFCWIADSLVFYISVVTYFSVIFLLNVSMFITVLLQISAMKCKQQKKMQSLLHDLKSTASLTFLLGLTWGFAFFAWGPVRITFLYLFAIANTLQGFFIFLFHCMMKENVRRQWRLHMCCGRFQLDNSSDWSRLAKAGSKSDKHAEKSHSSPSVNYNLSRSVANGSLSSTDDTSTWTFTKDWSRLDNAGLKAHKIAWSQKCSPESLKSSLSTSESNGSSSAADNNSARNPTNGRRYDNLWCVPSVKCVAKTPSTKRVLSRQDMQMNNASTFWDSM